MAPKYGMCERNQYPAISKGIGYKKSKSAVSEWKIPFKIIIINP
jgi:hypothetical protein